MKFLHILMFLGLNLMINAQESRVFSAIEQGTAEVVSQLMDSSIELCFDEKVDFLSKPQAKKALSNFFSKNPPKSFVKVHKGNSPGADSKYAIGKYTSTNGKIFRVYIFLKKGEGNDLIQELRFDSMK